MTHAGSAGTYSILLEASARIPSITREITKIMIRSPS
jgi:hypothetical protein